ncbi:MAG: peptide chain release factor N(5)-glutamine methyltransferase [Actinomycetota bacterium]|nr:peptide chain release factor N(5)-glutamine methyltransferase [Actinomycetota bacterium]
MEPKRVAVLLDLAERVLNDSTHLFDDHDHRRESEELMATVLGVDGDDLDLDERPSRRQRERFLSLVARRAGGEPFPLLIGFITFFGYDLKVKSGMFMPRPSSELVVERALVKLKGRRNPIVVDVATGTGPIALAIGGEVPNAEVWGTDIAPDMIKLGRSNARELELDNVRFKVGDMYGSLPPALEGRVDVVTGHIPYVPKEELDDLPAEVREFEPISTLSDETADGLFLMRLGINGAARWLKPGGWLLLEISDDLEKKVRRMCMKAGLEDHGAASDEDDLSIVVEARKPK